MGLTLGEGTADSVKKDGGVVLQGAGGHSQPLIHPPKLGLSPWRRVLDRRGGVEIERVGRDGELTGLLLPSLTPAVQMSQRPEQGGWNVQSDEEGVGL